MNRYLLDTRTFLWVLAADDVLSHAVREIIRDPSNEVVSVW